jgi:hypothetical protein
MSRRAFGLLGLPACLSSLLTLPSLRCCALDGRCIFLRQFPRFLHVLQILLLLQHFREAFVFCLRVV